eukprot:scaffold647906_cov35-Prasinocladus_malaysianus.AAC.1
MFVQFVGARMLTCPTGNRPQSCLLSGWQRTRPALASMPGSHRIAPAWPPGRALWGSAVGSRGRRGQRSRTPRQAPGRLAQRHQAAAWRMAAGDGVALYFLKTPN